MNEQRKLNSHSSEYDRLYTHVVGLGGDCRSSYQLKRYFRNNDAYPFDRWVTPLDSLAHYLAAPDACLYDPVDLLPIFYQGSVIGWKNKRYDLRFYHEWPKDPAIAPPHGEIIPGWEKFSNKATKRTSYLLRKLISLNKPSNSILFVRDGDWLSDLPPDRAIKSAEQAFEKVLTELETRFSLATFDILCLNFCRRYVARTTGNIFYIDLVDSTDDWRGLDDVWNSAFDRINARLSVNPGRNNRTN